MANKIRIASDSTCDLSPELIERFGVSILPLGVALGEKQYTDGVDIDPDFIYAHYEKTGELPKTSAVNLVDFEEYFARETAEGNAVVLFTISSEMSSTYNNARLAAESFENVHVVDTRNLSTGGGLLVIAAAEMAAKGDKTAAEIAGLVAEDGKGVEALQTAGCTIYVTGFVRFAVFFMGTPTGELA